MSFDLDFYHLLVIINIKFDKIDTSFLIFLLGIY